jgi:Papain-like cysteine protease AvrRpt2
MKRRKSLFAICILLFVFCPVVWSCSSETKSKSTLGAVAFQDPIDFRVSNPVFLIPQTKQFDCWAAVSAMLTSWKEKQRVPTPQFVARLSEKFRILYDTDAGILPSDQSEVIQKVGMRQEAPQSYSVDAWLNMLKSFGPLWVTTAFPKPGAKWGIHARVIFGIKGDGTPDGTKLHLWDPGKQRESDMSVSDFALEMDKMAKADDVADVRPLVIHF